MIKFNAEMRYTKTQGKRLELHLQEKFPGKEIEVQVDRTSLLVDHDCSDMNDVYDILQESQDYLMLIGAEETVTTSFNFIPEEQEAEENSQ